MHAKGVHHLQNNTEQIQNLNEIFESTIVNIALLSASCDIFKSFECNKKKTQTKLLRWKIQYSAWHRYGYRFRSIHCYAWDVCMFPRCMVRAHGLQFGCFRDRFFVFFFICVTSFIQQRYQQQNMQRISLANFTRESNKSSVPISCHFDSISIDLMRHRQHKSTNKSI